MPGMKLDVGADRNVLLRTFMPVFSPAGLRRHEGDEGSGVRDLGVGS